MPITGQQYIAKLTCIQKTFAEAEFFRLAVVDNLAKRSKRIFTDGKNSANGNIGQYSTKPLYINPNKSPKKFSPIGKTGNKVFKSGKKAGQPHKTKYFDTGFKQFRGEIGRQSNFVNLNLFGNLKSNFENNSRGQATPIKVSNLEYIVGLDRENALKKSGLTEKYGEIFDLTNDELKDFQVVAQKEFQKSLLACK